MNKPGSPFVNNLAYEAFKWWYCDKCINKDDCPVLDAIKKSPYREEGFPSEWIRRLESDTIARDHYCVRFTSNDPDEMKEYFEDMELACKEERKIMKMDKHDMDKTAVAIVERDILQHVDRPNVLVNFHAFIVWKAKILQNWKYMIASTYGNHYFEVTYNGDKNEWYLDNYAKVENKVIPWEE